MPEVNNPQMDRLRARADALETQKRAPIPTPEIGRIVLFYRNGDLTKTPAPGCVVGHGAPGQVDLKLFVRNSQNQENVAGIFYTEHPFARENPEVLKLKGGGLWTYREGDRPTEAHKQLHISELDKLLANIKAELLRERDAQLRRDATDKELSAGRASKSEKLTTG
jgi:hypothetical protein